MNQEPRYFGMMPYQREKMWDINNNAKIELFENAPPAMR